ncbi:hypothetical protein GF327_03130 [Candidatus Woesearchaeota archaeon]|nr:hypothetical protein [Candidatus Woesearchaeota archaeon]
MNNKSQLYIFAAVIFCTLVFLSSFSYVVIENPTEEVKQIYDNFIFESYYTINNAVYENKDINQQVKNLTITFIDYSKQKNINLGIFYVLIIPAREKSYIVNYLNSKANINLINTILPGTEEELNIGKNLTIELDNRQYSFNIPEGNDIQLKVLIRKQ